MAPLLVRSRLIPGVLAAAVALALPASAAQPEVVDSPSGRVASPLYLAGQYGRLADQVRHAEYRQRLDEARQACSPEDHCYLADPYVAAWTAAHLRVERGVLPGTAVAYELLAPRDTETSGQRPPAVLLLPGGFTPKETYRGVAQGLAASGYVVVSVDPECNVGCEPESPQDAALALADSLSGLATVAAPIISSCATTGCDYGALAAAYEESERTYQAAGRAALQWLADGSAGRVDTRRVAVVGHSLGAYNAALLAQQRDLPVVVRAAVSYDGYAALPDGLAPRVPVQFQVYEGQDINPHPFKPDETPSTGNALRFQTAGVPTQVLALRSSTHQEMAHIPYDPAAANASGASQLGERVALAGTLAWLGAHLEHGRRASAAREALLGPRLDGSADAVSHGQGRAGPDGANVPYTVAGSAWSDHLSLLLRSWYDLGGGTACADQLAGCR